MIKAKKDFSINGKFYFVGDEVVEKYEDVIKLNEKGFIEPLTTKQLYEIKNKKVKKEE
jgi:hypothetical protein